MKKILIVDDHPIVRSGVRNALRNEPEMIISGEAEDGYQAIKMLKKGKFDIVVLDLNLPKIDGLETLARIKVLKPLLPVLILSIHSAEEYAVRSLKSGASGYLPKDTKPRILIDALKKILAGGKYFPLSVAERLVDEFGTTDLPLHENLSHREFQIFKMIGSGMAPKEIASSLSISTRTVSTYRARVLAKMDFKSTCDVVKYCIENGINSMKKRKKPVLL